MEQFSSNFRTIRVDQCHIRAVRESISARLEQFKLISSAISGQLEPIAELMARTTSSAPNRSNSRAISGHISQHFHGHNTNFHSREANTSHRSLLLTRPRCCCCSHQQQHKNKNKKNKKRNHMTHQSRRPPEARSTRLLVSYRILSIVVGPTTEATSENGAKTVARLFYNSPPLISMS